MRQNGRSSRRRWSGGTIFMLCLLTVVLIGSAFVLLRLFNGNEADLSKLQGITGNGARETMALPDAGGPETTPEPAGSGKPEEAQETAAPAAAAETPRERSFTLTAGGAIALNGELRKNTLSADSKKYDYSDIMLLLARELTSDVNLAFLENILSDDYKASDIIAPETAADLLRSGGFTHIACGFPRAYEKGADGIAATWMSLSERRIKPLGIFDTDDKNRLTIFEINGIKTALLQYSANVAAKTRKAMEKDGAAGAVPEASAEIIAADIQNCRSQGVQAVIVLLDWGKAGKDPDKTQRALAAAIANAGADLIIGNGSHVPQKTEYLDTDDGGKVLCAWSLGTVLSGDRSNLKRLSGYLLHVTIRCGADGQVSVLNPEYTPIYTWKYKQDSRYFYRCLASDRGAPDGMDSDQRKQMEKSLDYVTELLEGSAAVHRLQEN